jgi:hypothetical protein
MQPQFCVKSAADIWVAQGIRLAIPTDVSFQFTLTFSTYVFLSDIALHFDL